MNDPRDGDSAFGINDTLEDPTGTSPDHLNGLGVSFVRLPLPMSDPSENFWTRADRRINGLVEKGIKILLVLSTDVGSAPTAEAARTFATAAVKRYKNRIIHWEFAHEPDDAALWQPQDEMRTYTALLRDVSTAIKTEDPSAIVHLAALGRGLPKSLKQVYAAGGRDYFDVVHIDPYLNPLMPDARGSLRYFHDLVYAALEREKDLGKPIWYAEIGCPGLRDIRQTPDWWLGKNPTEAMQADWLGFLYDIVRTWPGVAKVFWTRLRDQPGRQGNGIDFAGLVRPDETLKPAFDVYLEIASFATQPGHGL